MKTPMMWRSPICVSALGWLALALTACGIEQDNAASAAGALDEAPVAEAPVVEAPVVIDTTRIERADEALAAALDSIEDPEARFAARLAEFRRAEDELLRDDVLDRRSVLATGAALRARLLGTPEARRDGEEADQARSERGEFFVPTRADLASFEEARVRRDERMGDPAAAVPTEFLTPEGIATPTRPTTPTAEELRYGTH